MTASPASLEGALRRPEPARVGATTDPIRLRPQTSDDAEFLFRLYAGTRERELALTGWSLEQKEAFLRSQFAAQTAYYRTHFPDTAFDIVLVKGERVGRLYVSVTDSLVSVVDISLLPEFRGMGIGSFLLREIQESAGAKALPVALHVEKLNPAHALYRRLGFALARDDGVYWYMEWRPA